MMDKLVRTVEREGIVEVVLANPERRNALSRAMMLELTEALRAIGGGPSRGVVLGAEGPVFCSGHDLADCAGADLDAMRELLSLSARLMLTIQSLPQPALARVQGLATGAGCQLALTCDLVVASSEAAFRTPGGQGGWFCTTPMVAVARAVGRKRALEMLMTGDPIDAATAERWGMINRVVLPEALEAESWDLIRRATRGSRRSKATGKAAFYAHVDLSDAAAYREATEVMAAASQTPEAQERMRAFLEKRGAVYADGPKDPV